MTEQRRAEIIQRLMSIAGEFEPSAEEPELSMFWLVMRYNENFENPELIGGRWVRENVPELAELP